MSPVKTSGVLKTVQRVRGGVAVSHNKHTNDCEAQRIPAPAKVVLAMQQHIGAPCAPCVKVGDTVSVGQVIGDSEAALCVPIHASVSGKVTAIGELTLPQGVITQSITIESDGEMRLFEGLEPPKVTDKASLVAAARASGLMGLGGAGFPAHVKLNTPPDREIDTLIVNAAECEPFLTVDYRECLDNSWDILSGVYTLQEILGFQNVIIGVEDNKPKAIEVLARIAEKDDQTGDAVKLMTLPSQYPQGAEKMLVQAATGRKIPPGKLPMDLGCLVMNVASVAFLARYIKTGKPLVSRNLTVDGSAISSPKNVRAPIGTSLGEIIDFCGGFREEPFKLITGGPMMGYAVVSPELPTLKQNNAILAFASGTLRTKPERDCIRCGRCAYVCPMRLMPTQIKRYASAGDAERLQKIGTDLCMECGSCAYVCPAGLPLVQYLRLAKAVEQEASQT